MRAHAPAAPRPVSTPRGLARTLLLAGALSSLVTIAPAATTSGGSAATAATATSRAADSAGAAAVGAARYAVPKGAVYASPSGKDTNRGTASAPVRTITRAIALAPTGGTVVLRKGTFHESVTVTKSGLTIQNYPGEAVWLDGSSPVTGWAASGTVWVKTGWTPRFDASPTYTKGAPDGTDPGWQFVNPAKPMAAHPDMVFRGSTAMQQVKSLSLVKRGTNTFYLDEAKSRLYVGLDPTRSSMRATSLAKAISVRAANVTLKGFGVRRFGNSVWHMGAITLEGKGDRMVNMTVAWMATTGIAALAPDITLERVTVTRSGMLGVHASLADRLRVVSSALTLNNTEHFNQAPVSGGIKVHKSRTVTISRSLLAKNDGPGFWADQSVYDMRLVINNVTGNAGAGLFLEISAKAAILDNLVAGNRGNGVKVNNTSDVRIWNNTIISNNRELNIVEDSRLASNTSWGHDPRYPNDPTMTWLLGPVEVKNNVIGRPQNGNCLLCVEDYTYTRTAEQIGVRASANIYNRPVASPKWTHVWSSGEPNPEVYTTVKRFQSATGQDSRSVAYDGIYAVTPGGVLWTTARRAGTTAAVGLPSDLATMLGRSAGTRWMGVWGR